MLNKAMVTRYCWFCCVRNLNDTSWNRVIQQFTYLRFVSVCSAQGENGTTIINSYPAPWMPEWGWADETFRGIDFVAFGIWMTQTETEWYSGLLTSVFVSSCITVFGTGREQNSLYSIPTLYLIINKEPHHIPLCPRSGSQNARLNKASCLSPLTFQLSPLFFFPSPIKIIVKKLLFKIKRML
jgi:hypothetical protein